MYDIPVDSDNGVTSVAIDAASSGKLSQVLDYPLPLPVSYRPQNPSGGGGWLPSGETWTYSSTDDPTFTFTISGDKTDKYSPGMRIKLTQTTVKYFLITGVSYSSPNTSVTAYGGTDYDLSNASISSSFYSTQKAPQGFPLNPDKWTVQVTDTGDRNVTSPAKDTWYNPNAALQIDVPIGIWSLEYQPRSGATANSASYVFSRLTLSTTNNSESDAEMTSITGMDAASGTLQSYASQYRRKNVSLTSKTRYYLNVLGSTSAASLSALRIRGVDSMTVLRAISPYL